MQATLDHPPFSPDGRWWWDGQRWQPLYTPDGSHRWDGQRWLPVQAVAPAPAPARDPARPSWLPDEVRMPTIAPRAKDAPEVVPVAAPVAAVPLPAPAAPRSRSLVDTPHFGKLVAGAMIAVVALGAFAWSKLNGGDGSIAPDVLAASDARLVYAPSTVEKYWVHETQHGRLTFPDGTSQDTQSDVDAHEVRRVISVAADGTATIGFKFESLTGFEDGQPVYFNAAKAKEITIIISPDGRIVSGGTNGSASPKANQSVPGADQGSSILPSRSVQQGEKWGREWDRPNPVGTGTMHYSTVNEFVRYDNSPAGEVAVIHTSATLPIDMLLDLHQILALYGDDDPTIPGGAAVKYGGKYTADIQSNVDLATHQLSGSMATEDFDFDMAFQGLGTSAAAAALAGKWHYGGRQVSQTTRLSVAPAQTI